MATQDPDFTSELSPEIIREILGFVGTAASHVKGIMFVNKWWHCQALHLCVETALKLHSILHIGPKDLHIVRIIGQASYSKLSTTLYCLKTLPAFILQLSPGEAAIEWTHIKQLMTLTNMEGLNLYGINKEQAPLGHLSCLTALQCVHLFDSVDTHWLPISLTKLDVDVPVPASDWNVLSRLQNLKQFTLRSLDNQATRSILPMIRKLTALEELIFSDVIHTSADYRMLGRLDNTGLTHLILRNHQIINQPTSLNHIRKLTALKRLEISETEEDDISAIASMTNLVDLYSYGCSTESVLLFTALTNLTSLALCSPPSMLQPWLQAIAALSTINSLRILDSGNINDRDLMSLSASKSLTALWLHNPEQLTPSASVYLAQATNLRSLVWSGRRYSDDAFSALQRSCPLLNIQTREDFVMFD